MGVSLSTPLVFDPFDPEAQRRRFVGMKGTSPVTSSSSLASTASIIEATGNLIMGTNAPQLYEHALIGDWKALLRRIVVHPKEACYKDKCANTALHVSCRRQPPPEVLEALISANPDAVVSRTMDGLTPLHFCCFCGSSPETIRLVIGEEICLREMVDRRGRTPLHCVCAGFRSPHRLPVVRMLLELDPSCATAVDEKGRTPLSLIVDDYVEELHDALQASEEIALRATLEGGDLYDCWKVVTFLLRAAYSGTLEDNNARNNEVHVDGKFRILHAAVGISGCPAEIIRLILKINPTFIEGKDGDLNLPLHVACKTVGQPWLRKVEIRKSGVVVYNADFGHAHPKDDVTSELIRAYPNAATVPDDSGKVPLILAVESGKPWATSLQPLWHAYNLDNESFSLLEKALRGGLTSMSPALRNETIKTMKYIIPLWPAHRVDDMVVDMIDFARELNTASEDSADEWNMAIQDSTLQGVATMLQYVDTGWLELRDTPQQALDMVLPLLCNQHETVRVAAAKVLGAAVAIMGVAATELVLKEVIFPVQSESEQDDGSVSTMGLSCANSTDMVNSESDDFLHGRAMACTFLFDFGKPRILTTHQQNVLKQWMKHEAVIVRKGACWAVGSTLCSSKDLKEFKSPILKCMRATEDVTVHLALSQSLVGAVKRHHRLFLCKSGLPLLDGALMLSMSRGTSALVQQSFQNFLWHALQKQESGLQEYMKMAEGENGRIMMSLVTQKLLRLPVVEEEDEGKQDID